MDRFNILLEEVASLIGTKIVSAVRFQEGQSHEVYKISTEGGGSYTLRIPKDETATLIAKRGTALLKALKHRQPSLRIPSVIHESQHFVILQFISGGPLESWNNITLSPSRRNTLLARLGELMFQIWTNTTSDMPLSVPITYKAWLINEVDKGLRRSLNNSGWGDPAHFLHRRTIVHQMVPDDDNSLMVLKHGDLNAWNILVNEMGLTGVIDWDTAQMVPLAAAVQHPLFIADIPGWRNDNVPLGMTFEDDRNELERIIYTASLSSSLPTAKEIPNLLHTSRERQFFEMSLRNKRINAEFTLVKLVPNRINKTLAVQNLVEFLELNPDLQSNLNVRKLESNLREASD
ncbi:hypothetical protein ACKVV7_000208 [Pyricularia oryzae]